MASGWFAIIGFIAGCLAANLSWWVMDKTVYEDDDRDD
jgi:hypothetical protein